MTLPRYPAYKDSGVEWLGEVPAEWVVSKLGYLFSEPPCYGVLVPDFDPDGVPMLRITDMESEHIDNSGLTTISLELSMQYSRTIVQVGDVVLSLVGTIGKAFEVTGKLHGVNLSRAIARLQLQDDTLPRYLCWIFQSKGFSHFTDLVCRGTAQRVLNISDLIAFRFTFPPYKEQVAISTFLDEEIGQIDGLIAEQKNLIALLKEKRQAVISHAVTKGLNPDVPMKDSGVEWLGEVPEHWHVSPLKWLTGPGRDIMYGIVLPGPNVEEGVPIVKGGDVRPVRLRKELLNRTTAEIEAPFARARLNPGDIVYSIRGSIGDAELVPEELRDANITQDVARISPHSEVCGRWLLFVMKSAPVFVQLEQRSLGAAVRGINIFDLKRALIPVPSGAEQEAIADFLERQTVMIDSLIAESEHAVALLTERRSALISAAVTGKIDVRGLASQEAA